MSYSSDLKTELSKIRPSGCCSYAEIFGILVFGRSFSSDEISFTTENKEVADLIANLISACFEASVKTVTSGSAKVRYKLSVKSQNARQRIVNYYTNKNLTYMTEIIKKECCSSAFLRGAFISCGVMYDPNSRYCLEFSIGNEETARLFFDILKELKFNPKISKRGNKTVVYFRDGLSIEDFLTRIKAPQYTLEFMEVEVYKDMRVNINRKSNCETANISKTVNAALVQIKSIEYLESIGVLETLPRELVSAAKLRAENPDMSLSELLKNSDLDITRSGLNHRLQKIVAIAEKIKSEKARGL